MNKKVRMVLKVIVKVSHVQGEDGYVVGVERNFASWQE